MNWRQTNAVRDHKMSTLFTRFGILALPERARSHTIFECLLLCDHSKENKNKNSYTMELL